MEFKFILTSQLQALPVSTGVYGFFATPKLRKSEGGLLYIGKAINIKERVKNHFQQPNYKDNIFIPETIKIGFIVTDSKIEALLLEAKLIKKYQPKYNTVWRDDKSHNYVFITEEEFPRVFVGHQPQLTNNKKLITNNKLLVISPMSFVARIGPFVDGKALKQTLRILRRVFLFRTCRILPKKPCLYKDLNLCPAPCINDILPALIGGVSCQSLRKKHYTSGGSSAALQPRYSPPCDKITKTEYTKNIKKLLEILQGKKPQVLRNLKKEMLLASQKQNYEKAQGLRDQIMALENVFSHSHLRKKQEGANLLPDTNRKEVRSFLKLQKVLGLKNRIKRIEGYDISNIQGQQATGSMVVFEQGKPNKNEYRKFKIKITGQPNDTAMLKEMLSRRLKHKEWPMPQVILIDGGIGQLNVALKLKTKNKKLKNTKIISLAKRKNELFLENQPKPILLKNLPRETTNLILQIRDEAHRFAITYHKKLRSDSFLP